MRCNAVCAGEVFCGNFENVRFVEDEEDEEEWQGKVSLSSAVAANDPPGWVVYAASLTATLLDETNPGDAVCKEYACLRSTCHLYSTILVSWFQVQSPRCIRHTVWVRLTTSIDHLRNIYIFYKHMRLHLCYGQ
jgi:hypothetical protein